MRSLPRAYILFIAADGCSKILQAGANWNVPPTIDLPVTFPTKVVDWVNDPSPSQPPEIGKMRRRYRLETEEALDDGVTVIFTYREVE